MSQKATLIDPSGKGCPFPVYERLREQEPVSFMPDIGMFFVACYDLARDVLRNTAQFSNQSAEGDGRLFVEPSEAAQQILITKGFGNNVPTMVTNDPPTHGSYRKLVEHAFRASRIRQMEGYVREIASELVDRFADKGECELIADFAVPLPLFVISDMLGIPRSDYIRFKGWSDAWLTMLALKASEEESIEAAHLAVDMHHYFVAAIAERRVEPRDDLLTDLAQASYEDERPLTDREILSIINQLLVAGNETTTNGIAGGLKLLAQDAELAQRLRQAPTLVPKFVEEVLRLEAPVQCLIRFVHADVELAGVKIPAGSRVLVGIASANRDCAKFEGADDVDLERRKSGAHFAFGAGIHHCVGSELARVEMREAFSIWLSRFSSISLAGDVDDIVYLPSFGVRGPRALPLRMTRRQFEMN
jgi:cytochrome P450